MKTHFRAWDYMLRLSWVKAPVEYRPVKYNTVRPPLFKLNDGRLVVDQCMVRNDLWHLLERLGQFLRRLGFRRAPYTIRHWSDRQSFMWRCEVKVFDNKDHPDLKHLPPHTPRSVKVIMRRENRLKYLRATDSVPYKDFLIAQSAWDQWWPKQQRSPPAGKLTGSIR